MFLAECHDFLAGVSSACNPDDASECGEFFVGRDNGLADGFFLPEAPLGY